jgi:3-hydroxybutyryl-CoA dehydratase
LELNDLNYSDIRVGHVFEFKRTLSEEDVKNFAKLTGDFNPLHCNEEYAKSTKFKKRVVHGMLAASLFSTLLGMVCPGKKNLYLTQTLKFQRPIFLDSDLTVRGTVKDKIDGLNIIVIDTEIIVNAVVVIQGEARVKILGD